jgi:superkiller protein 3
MSAQHRRNYVPAIHAYQTALRADPDDQVSWLRLGEGYSKAGRYAAAVKALGRAQELDPSDWMCNYFMGEVLRQTGQFSEAIAAFTLILETRPGELGALMALAQTRLDLGRAEELAGFAARAEASCIAAIGTAMEAMAGSPGFRRMAWKVVGDALFSLAQRATFALEDEVRAALNTCLEALGSESSPRVKELFTVELSQGGSDSPLKGKAALELAITAYEYRRSLGSKDDPSYSSSWADLAVALQAIDAITTAIRADPGNDALWVTLGDIQFEKSPKAAQHAYIRALEIDKTVSASNAYVRCQLREVCGRTPPSGPTSGSCTFITTTCSWRMKPC